MVWAVSLSTVKLIPHSLTPVNYCHNLRSLNGFGNLVGPLLQSVLYSRGLLNGASPKAISRSTSYLRVRLAFHPYPQLIPWFFNTIAVRTSTGAYSRFILDMGRSPGFGSTIGNLRPLQTRFRCGYASCGLTYRYRQ